MLDDREGPDVLLRARYALLLGVHPRAVPEWYLAMYVDAVERAERPNPLSMSQLAAGGLVASKPHAAIGKYIQWMSNYCPRCRYDPADAVGQPACPFTPLYGDFLLCHEGNRGEAHQP